MIVFKSSQDKVLAALQAVAGIVERRHTLPILANVLIRKTGPQLQLTTSDLEIQIRTTADLGGDSGAFATTLGARKLIDILRTMPGDQTVAFLAVESKIKDRKDPQGALADLAAISFPADQPRLAIRHALLTAEAWKALGMQDSVNVIAESLRQKYPDNAGVQRAIESLRQP